ncbi:hypothetical protein [Pelagibaculum spongiae]|uniref:Uncharacterized protein n=1 Tax=Pelagibaculum spongiae TaxID=2080658 RepID=A0A2V1H165_9GAMM|nr:hypothetical protein [Pelagibaculum spongiae]PVZ68320.1 hypothetical protein DC094_13620 [Pelagibaculum spongiae]
METIKISDLRPGDILLTSYYHIADETELVDKVNHCMLWVDHEKNIVHATDGSPNYALDGIFQHSSSILNKQPAYVIRCVDRALAIQAAKYAIGWSIKSGFEFENYKDKHKKRIIEIQEQRREHKEAIPLETPFGYARLVTVLSDQDIDISWSPPAFFKAYQAYIRAESKVPLSKNKGVFCSQFILTCYQAAAIKIAISKRKFNINSAIETQAMRDPHHLSNKKSKSELIMKIHESTARSSKAIPDYLHVYAKKSDLEKVLRFFLSNGDFVFMGRVEP